MDAFSGNLVADLLDLTTRYLVTCNLKSFLLPLPFCDETILNRRGLLAKILSNASSLTKRQLFECINCFKRETRTMSVMNSHFDRAYNSTIAGKEKTRPSRKIPPHGTGTRATSRALANAMGEKRADGLSSLHHPAQVASRLDMTVREISKEESVGFVLIIAAETSTVEADEGSSKWELIPIAGGVVEILDPEEHCLRCVWCDPRLTVNEDTEFGKIVALRLLGHIFDYGYPGAPSNNKLKHISVLNVLGILFPRSIYTFMLNGLKFGKHFETKDNGGSHEDTSTHFCRCQRLEDSDDADLFWGISESRLKSTFTSIRSQVAKLPSKETLEILNKIVANHS